MKADIGTRRIVGYIYFLKLLRGQVKQLQMNSLYGRKV